MSIRLSAPSEPSNTEFITFDESADPPTLEYDVSPSSPIEDEEESNVDPSDVFRADHTGDLVWQSYDLWHPDLESDSPLAVRGLTSRPSGPSYAENDNGANSRIGLPLPRPYIDNSHNPFPGTSGESSNQEISSSGESYIGFINTYTPENCAFAGIREAAGFTGFPASEEYLAELGQYITIPTANHAGNGRKKPQTPNVESFNHKNIPFSFHKGLEQTFQALDQPSQSLTRSALNPLQHPSAPVHTRFQIFRNDTHGTPRYQGLRQRTENIPGTRLSDQGPAPVPWTGETRSIRDLQAATLDIPHRKRRRAGEPIRQAELSGPSITAKDLSEQQIQSLFVGQRPARRASTGGATRSRLRGSAPPFIPLTQSNAGSSLVSDPNIVKVTDLRYERNNKLTQKNVLSKQHLQLYLPPQLVGNSLLLFTSEIYPRRFNARQRACLTHIFRTKARYVPACVYMISGLSRGLVYYLSEFTCASARICPNLPLGPGKRGWPAGRVPVEVFSVITKYLPRESMRAMRLVNGEFEMKTSNEHFHTVVVPFRPEIYGMMTHRNNGEDDMKRRRMNKGKAKAEVRLEESPEQDNCRTVHDGMKVFEAWGPHIKRFAMAFEVDDATLENAPVKGKFEEHMTWWGGYKWPHPYYNRYEFCEGLEKKADEFKCMSEALSYLQDTKELGLSLDSGLGWLTGPDMSDRAKNYRAKSQVFGKRHLHPGPGTTRYNELRQDMTDSHGIGPKIHSVRQTEGGFVAIQVRLSRSQNKARVVSRSDQKPRRALMFEGVDLGTVPCDLDPDEHGKYAVEGLGALGQIHSSRFAAAALKPQLLTVAQQEWLLETEWAQRAFLSSFCMALADNSQTFQQVHNLNISKLSSRYLSALQREDIWRALPNLSKLTINVSADWRNILKSDTGPVEAPAINPSKAATQFYVLLKDYVSHLHHLRILNIGYVGGGEHQVGIFGRNKFILPAPLMDYSDPTTILNPPATVLKLAHVERLTFSNCWMAPHLLKMFAAQVSLAKLRFLNLESVSLTSSFPIHAETINICPGDGTFDVPQGPPRLGCPTVGNFFEQRQWAVADSCPFSWAVKGQRIDSWGSVIDAITPGATMDFIRYVFRYRDEPPVPRVTNLERLTFDSCGYVRLTNYKDFHQYAIDEVSDQLPHYLLKRAVDLYPVMMSCPSDLLLGEIVPSLKHEEEEVLSTAFPMRIGWLPEEYEKSLDNREDGQPLGGSGRFSGVIEKLILPLQET